MNGLRGFCAALTLALLLTLALWLLTLALGLDARQRMLRGYILEVEPRVEQSNQATVLTPAVMRGKAVLRRW